MRHVHVTRLIWGVTITFAAAATGLALSRPGAVPVASDTTETAGAALYAAQCAQCHGRDHILDWGRAEPDPAAREAWLDDLLTRHFAPPEDERPLIVAYIQAVIAEEEEG